MSIKTDFICDNCQSIQSVAFDHPRETLEDLIDIVVELAFWKIDVNHKDKTIKCLCGKCK